MADITLTIPDPQLPRVIHALCKAYGYEETGANAKRAVIGFVKQTVFNVERAEAETAALATVQDPDTDGIAT